jgi:alpha-1,6-mannosyltransferase
VRIPHGIVSNPQRLTGEGGRATVAACLISSGRRDNGVEGHAKMDLCDKGTIHQRMPYELVPRGLLMLCPINNLHNEGSVRFVKFFAKSESIRTACCLSLLMGGTSIAKPPSTLSTSPTMEPIYNSAESDFPSNRLPCTIFWIVAGLLMVGLHLALARLSSGFDYETPIFERPILSLVLIELIAGAVFMTTIWGIRLSLPGNRALMTWVFAVGALLRAIMMTSTPMLETDFYRYMWDGAVLANGASPYRYSPEEAAKPSESVPIALQKLAHESGNVITQVNHPELRTIYPPVAQVFFAAAYFLGPWSILSLRIVLAVFDAATLLLLLTVLRGLNLSSLFIVIYWWNPLVVKEIFNSAHMDVIAVPLVLAALILTGRARHLNAAGVLALAVGAKLWPVVLLPVVLSRLWRVPRQLFLAVALFSFLSLILLLPVYLGGFDWNSGFLAYGRQWEMNDAFFMALTWGVAWFAKLFPATSSVLPFQVDAAARIVTLLILGAWIAWLSRNHPAAPPEFWERSLLIVAALFLLSPTQFPWYYLWVTPFLVIKPRFSLLLLGALLPLYYLRFYYAARDNVGVFDYYIVWLEYIPIWCMLIYEWLVASGARAGKPLGETHASPM